jgi:amino-acid N-acetyltransferase
MIPVLRERNSGQEPPPDGSQFTIRKATMHDVLPILDLINGYAAQGMMLPRTELEMSEAIRGFTVLLREGRLLGCGALHFYSPLIGEIRSLAVHPQAKGQGAGRQLVETLVQEAEAYDLDAVFAFTYVTGFFEKLGFHVVERGLLPLKVWKDCLRCPKFQACDETAVLRVLRPESRPERWLEGSAPTDGSLIQLPTQRPR